MALTIEIIARLEAIGVQNPAGSRWRRIKPSFEPVIYAAEIVCLCGDRHKRVSMVPFEHDGQHIHIGQCSECHEITWSNWLAPKRQWGGPSRIEAARPLYDMTPYVIPYSGGR